MYLIINLYLDLFYHSDKILADRSLITGSDLHSALWTPEIHWPKKKYKVTKRYIKYINLSKNICS